VTVFLKGITPLPPKNSLSRNKLIYITHNDIESLTKPLTFPKFRDSVVGIMTRLPVGRLRILVLARAKKYSLFQSIQNSSSIWVSGALFPGVKPPT